MGKILLPGALVGTGLAVILVSALLGFVFVPNIIENKIEETQQLKNTTEEEKETWERWRINPVPVYLKFYLWDITNEEEILKGHKPIITEKGPYVFSEIREKHVKKIDEEKGEITYSQTITYHFDEKLSKDCSGNQLRLTDRINVINLPFISVSQKLVEMKLGEVSKLTFNALRNAGESIVKKDVTVNETLFAGWVYPDVYKALLAFGGIQPEFQGGRFGFYRGKNGTSDGEYIIKTGSKSSEEFGKIISFRGMSQLNFWDNPKNTPKSDPKYCNAINGTDGAIFPPFVTKESVLPIFVSDICRSVALEYVEEEEHLGVTGYKFGFPEDFYSHPMINNDNYCFCPSPKDSILESGCAKGLIRLFSCRAGAPLITSAPHFYNGDPNFQEKLIGLRPNKTLHDTAITVQPNSGYPLKVRKRIQMSLELQNYGNFFGDYFKYIHHMAIPALWASEETELDEKLIDELKGKLLTPIRIVDIAKWVFIAVGGVLAAGGIFVFIKMQPCLHPRLSTHRKCSQRNKIDSTEGKENLVDDF